MADKKFDAEKLKGKAGGIIGYLKHVIKDPVNSIEEIETRKKELKPLLKWSLIIIGGAFAFIIVFSLLARLFKFGVPSFVTMLITLVAFVGCIGVVIYLFMGFVLKKGKEKFILLECPSCHARITYDDERVGYKVLNEYTKKETKQTNNRITVEQTTYAHVEINCICQECGAEKKFEQKFRVARYVDGIEKYFHTTESLVKGFFGNTIQIG